MIDGGGDTNVAYLLEDPLYNSYESDAMYQTQKCKNIDVYTNEILCFPLNFSGWYYDIFLMVCDRLIKPISFRITQLALEQYSCPDTSEAAL